jgi:hypothetical protein
VTELLPVTELQSAAELLPVIEWIPVTVIAAVSLFVIREVLDFRRKKGERRRKSLAAKSLLKFEIERNNYTKNRLFQILEDINNNFDGVEGPSEFELNKTPSSDDYYTRIDPGMDEPLQSGSPLPRVHMEEFERWLPIIAEVDQKLFKSTMTMYTTIFELEHLRSGLVDYISDERHMLEGFVSYALNQSEDMDTAFKKYYKEIANTEEIPIRMR